MANNMQKDQGRHLYLPVASGVESGDPVAVGQITGVAMIDRDAANSATIDTEGVYLLAVGGVNAGGNSAVAVGDAIYFVVADTPKLNKKTSGVLFGYALGTVASGGSGTIPVKLK